MEPTLQAVVGSGRRHIPKRLIIIVITVVLLVVIAGTVVFLAQRSKESPTTAAQKAIKTAETLQVAGNNSAAVTVLQNYVKSQSPNNASSLPSTASPEVKSAVAQVQKTLGSVYATEGNPAQAAQAYQQAMQTDPSIAGYSDYLSLGDQYAKQGDKAAAIKAYQQALSAVQADPSSVPIASSYEQYLQSQIAELSQ